MAKSMRNETLCRLATRSIARRSFICCIRACRRSMRARFWRARPWTVALGGSAHVF
jgi:hypothetical protein